MEKEIIIEYKPNTDTLVKVSKYLLLRMRFVKFIIFIFFFVLLQNIALSATQSVTNIKWDFFDLLPFGMVILVWITVYFLTMYSIKKNILKNKKNLESQKITITKDSFTQEAESFKIENFWKESFQIKETKDWFLIYLNKTSALPIIKEDLKENQYNELKQLFNSIDIKKSLKS
ncbi:YcxB-like protein [Flavobacterium sp. 9]|uniref:YcxB family protein n=1 Tax=Flavobacterium sp. 9 TaxID=2035198 RepID=UPI000C17E3D4|nr:YcxB family protein [Flavobacterium sp. 9]PIF33049.1 YcxB-like protein [Flavobacterium sp. 9]